MNIDNLLVAPMNEPKLKIDKRGRVRFGTPGRRFEVTQKNGIRIYDRHSLWSNRELRSFQGIPGNLLRNKAFLVKLSTALNLVGIGNG